jgi:hypothetical protein
MRFKTSCSLSFLSTFFSSKREVLLSVTPLVLKDVPVWLKEVVELANYFGREQLYSDLEHFLIEEMSFLNEKSTFS